MPPSASCALILCALRLPTPGRVLCSRVTANRATSSDSYVTRSTPRVAPSCLRCAASTTSLGAGDVTSSTSPHARAASSAASGSIPSGSPASRSPASATVRGALSAASAGCEAGADLRAGLGLARKSPETGPVSLNSALGASLSLSPGSSPRRMASALRDACSCAVSPSPPPPLDLPSNPLMTGAFLLAVSMVTARPSTLNDLLLATADAASSASAKYTKPYPLDLPPGPLSATMKASLTGPNSLLNASVSDASVVEYGRFLTNTTVFPPPIVNVPSVCRASLSVSERAWGALIEM